jgi:hypothetical protein
MPKPEREAVKDLLPTAKRIWRWPFTRGGAPKKYAGPVEFVDQGWLIMNGRACTFEEFEAEWANRAAQIRERAVSQARSPGRSRQTEQQSPPNQTGLRGGSQELLVISGRQVLLRGRAVSFRVTPEKLPEIICFLRALNRQPRLWVTGPEIDRRNPKYSGTRWDRLRKRLPASLKKMIESGPLLGYRIKWRN